MATKLSECDPGDEQIITALHNIITQENVVGYDKDCLKQLASGCALLIKALEEALLNYCFLYDQKKTSVKRKAELKVLISTNNLKMGQWVKKADWINKQITLLIYAQKEGVTPGGSEAEGEDEGEQDVEDDLVDGQITSSATQRTQDAPDPDEEQPAEFEEAEQPAAAATVGDRGGSSKQAAAIPRPQAPAAVSESREDTTDDDQEQPAAPAGAGRRSGSSKQSAIPRARPQAPAAVSESRVLSLESRLVDVENTQALRRAVPQFTDSDETVQQKFTASVPFKLRSSKSNMLHGSAELLSSDWFSSDGIQVRAYIGEQAVSPTEVVFKAAYSLLNDVRRSAAAEKGSDIGTCPFIEWLKDPSLSVPVSSDFNFDPTVTTTIAIKNYYCVYLDCYYISALTCVISVI